MWLIDWYEWLIDAIDWLIDASFSVVCHEASLWVVFHAEFESVLEITLSVIAVIDWCNWLIDASFSVVGHDTSVWVLFLFEFSRTGFSFPAFIPPFLSWSRCYAPNSVPIHLITLRSCTKFLFYLAVVMLSCQNKILSFYVHLILVPYNCHFFHRLL